MSHTCMNAEDWIKFDKATPLNEQQAIAVISSVNEIDEVELLNHFLSVRGMYCGDTADTLISRLKKLPCTSTAWGRTIARLLDNHLETINKIRNTMDNTKVLSRDSLEWIFANVNGLSRKTLPLLHLSAMTAVERVNFGIKHDDTYVWDYLF